jgi:selenocysteine lyase/cysteine desulfurase
VSQAVALAAAIDYLTAVGMPRIAAHEAAFGARLVEGLSAIDGVRVLGAGIDLPRVGLASFDVDGIHSHDLGEMFGRDSRYAACSAGEVETFLLWPAQLSQGCLD